MEKKPRKRFDYEGSYITYLEKDTGIPFKEFKKKYDKEIQGIENKQNPFNYLRKLKEISNRILAERNK